MTSTVEACEAEVTAALRSFAQATYDSDMASIAVLVAEEELKAADTALCTAVAAARIQGEM